jgi:hypothetical protein
VVEGLLEMAGVEAALEIGGGTAFVTPVPNLPEFKIYKCARCVVRKKRQPKRDPRHK